MSGLHVWLERIWWRDAPPPFWLRLFEPFYAFINRLNLERRAAHALSAAVPLVSVGNITVGGSGKTPFVIWLANALKNQGYHPAILCRGDGGKMTHPVLVSMHADPAEVGDEAVLLRQQTGCPVIAGRDRVKGAEMAAELGDIIILDDGFQYRQLQRDCDIVLVPAAGVGNGRQLPAGPLREPIASLKRADIIVRSGETPSTPVSDAREWRWRTSPGSLIDIMDTGAAPPTAVLAVSGIARPERFFRDLEQTGLSLFGRRVYPDHYRYTAADAASLVATGHPIAVTGKDAVKLARLWPKHQPLWVLPQRAFAEPGLLESIQAMIRKEKQPQQQD